MRRKLTDKEIEERLENSVTKAKFYCEHEKNKKCGIDKKIPCCFFCKFLPQCYREWQKALFYCKTENLVRWCSTVKKFLDKNGLPKLKEDWRIA